MNLKNWLKAARLRTLPLSVSGIIVGAGLAGFYDINTESTNYCIFGFALLTTILLQVLSNYANDYGDGVKGTDAKREGEKRLVASGEISAKQMKNAVVIFSILSLLSAIALFYFSFNIEQLKPLLVFVVLASISVYAAIKYTVGKSAYGYSGFGDIFVLTFFGFMAVLGTSYLFSKSIDLVNVFPALTIGLLSTAVLNLNNLRDVNNDRKANKNTLVVKMGYGKGKVYHYALLMLSLVSSIIFTISNNLNGKHLLIYVAFIPLVLNAIKVSKTENPSKLDSELKKVALSTFLYAIIFTITII